MKFLAYWMRLSSLLLTPLAVAQTAPDKLALPHNATLKVWERQRQAVETAIYQRLIFPPECLRYEVNGSVFIKLTVTPDGNVQRIIILKSLVEPFDLAVIKAARQLRFQPRPLEAEAVSFVVGISFEKAVDWSTASQPRAAKKVRRRNSTR